MLDKKTIRKEILRKRDSIQPEIRQIKDRLIMDKVISLPDFLKAKTIFYFASFRSEVNTLPQIEEALRSGKRIVLPKVDNANKRLKLYEILNTDEIKLGFWGIPEPEAIPERERDINEVDLVIMPGVAFDTQGTRLGYGAGYYDKLLSGLKRNIPLIAIAYEEQIVDTLPSEDHDVRIDMIVTDKRIIVVDKIV